MALPKMRCVMADLEESTIPSESHSPESSAQSAPYTAKVTDAGCSHCGSGKRFRIIGPGTEPIDGESPDHYIGWSEGMIQDEVDRLNRLYEVIRQRVSMSPGTAP
jgi:hypothetical protein